MVMESIPTSAFNTSRWLKVNPDFANSHQLRLPTSQRAMLVMLKDSFSYPSYDMTPCNFKIAISGLYLIAQVKRPWGVRLTRGNIHYPV